MRQKTDGRSRGIQIERERYTTTEQTEEEE